MNDSADVACCTPRAPVSNIPLKAVQPLTFTCQQCQHCVLPAVKGVSSPDGGFARKHSLHHAHAHRSQPAVQCVLTVLIVRGQTFMTKSVPTCPLPVPVPLPLPLPSAPLWQSGPSDRMSTTLYTTPNVPWPKTPVMPHRMCTEQPLTQGLTCVPAIFCPKERQPSIKTIQT